MSTKNIFFKAMIGVAVAAIITFTMFVGKILLFAFYRIEGAGVGGVGGDIGEILLAVLLVAVIAVSLAVLLTKSKSRLK